MSLCGRARRAGRKLALGAGLGVVALGLVLASVGFFAAGLFLWAEQAWGAPRAAAVSGVALLLLAALAAGAVYRMLRAQPDDDATGSVEQELLFGATALLGNFIRRDPKWAMLAALAAGALAEYFTPGRKRD